MDDATLHHLIISFFLERQRAPAIREIALRFQCHEDDVRRGLRALADNHGVVLHPASNEIWVAHPFSAVPTTFVVRSGERTWWANCAWCSLGLTHLTGGTATIETRLGGIDDHIAIRIVDGVVVDEDFVVHFPIAMRHAWDCVIYTCSIMLLFRNEAEVTAWSAARGLPKGDVRPIRQVCAFAADWYGRHDAANWAKWSTAEAAEIFSRHHLTGPTWTLSTGSSRF